MAESTQPSLAPGTNVAGYVVEERIGVGGFGEVFRAKHPVIGREVAIKVLYAKYSADPAALARFVAEARAVNQISHAGIVEVFDFGTLDDGRAYHVLELLGGQTLRDLLHDRGRLPLNEALPLFRGIAEAVDAAHAQNIAHRDLKPDNVFVLEDGRTKLIDFGLAKLMRDGESPATQTGSVFGTPMYMSPEQCRGTATDTRTDLYSFGVLAYHVLVGEPPFSGDAIELALHHVNDRAVPPSKRCPELPRYVDHVIMALLAKDPIDRPPSLGTAVSALEGSITLRRRRRRAVRRLLSAAIVVGGVAVGARALWPGPHDACAPATARLAGIWDASVKDTLAKKFVGRPAIVESWAADARSYDVQSAKWAAQWDAACHAKDRESDPLLYAQRVTCLENVLIEMRGRTEALARIDAKRDFSFPTYGRTLADCANPDVLRSQVAAPAPAIRDRVSALVVDAFGAYVDAEYGADQRTSMEDGLARLDTIAKELEKLHPPAAAIPILMRTQILVGTTWDVASRLPRAREALDDAIMRIRAMRDDDSLAAALLQKTNFLLVFERDGDVVAPATAALAEAEQANARAGNSVGVRAGLLFARSRLAARNKDFDGAAAALRDSEKLMDSDDPEAPPYGWFLLPITLELAGRHADAIAEFDRFVEKMRKNIGPLAVRWIDTPRAIVLEYAGDYEAALAATAHILEGLKENEAPSYKPRWARAVYVALQHKLSKASDADIVDAVHDLANRGTTPAKQSRDGIATARRAGHFDIAARTAELDLAREGDQASDETLDAAAYFAFARGDRAKAIELARRVAARCAKTPCTDWIRRSRWLALLDAPTTPTPALDALDREYGGDRTAVANSAILLAGWGRWDEAAPRLEAARKIPNVWERQSDLLELDTWLGLARLHAGDGTGARAAFEDALDALSIEHNGFDGFDYARPVAELELARLLWDATEATDATRARAKRLATRASDGFSRLGSLDEAKKLEAARWLADHP